MAGDITKGYFRRMITNIGWPKYIFAGSTSGSTTVQASAVASGTVTLPAATDTLVGKATTDTLTNKTLTSPSINGGTITGATITGAISTSTVRTSAAVTANATTTYANVTGLSQTVVSGGTYAFRLILPSTVASGTGGIKYCFNYTTTVLSALQSSAAGFTASAVAVQNVTSTTTQADLFTQAAVVIRVEVEGTFVVTTGGTIDVQVAQNTSNASNTVAIIGGSFALTRIA